VVSSRATSWPEPFVQAIFSKRISFSQAISSQATFSKRISFLPVLSARFSFAQALYAKTTFFSPAISSPHSFYELALFAGRLSLPSSGVLSLQPSDVSH
jgi:hypothetical protein